MEHRSRPSPIGMLMETTDRLVGGRNTVLLIEHHLDVIRQADWVIDLGPEGAAPGARCCSRGRPRN